MRYLLLLTCLIAGSIALGHEPDSSESAASEIKSTCDDLSRTMVTEAFIRFGGELTPEIREQLQRSLRERLNEQPMDLRQIIREHAEMKRLIKSRGLNRVPKPKPVPPAPPEKELPDGVDRDKELRDAVEEGFPEYPSFYGVS